MADFPRQPLSERLQRAIEGLLVEVQSRMLDEWYALDVTVLQAKVMDLLCRSGPMRMGEIAMQMDHTLSATTNIIERLVDKDLVQRVQDRTDRRVVLCELTEEGRTATKRLGGIEDDLTAQALKHIADDEMETVIQVLETMCSRMALANGSQ